MSLEKYVTSTDYHYDYGKWWAVNAVCDGVLGKAEASTPRDI